MRDVQFEGWERKVGEEPPNLRKYTRHTRRHCHTTNAQHELLARFSRIFQDFSQISLRVCPEYYHGVTEITPYCLVSQASQAGDHPLWRVYYHLTHTVTIPETSVVSFPQK